MQTSMFRGTRRVARLVLALAWMAGAAAHAADCTSGWQLDARHDQHSDALALSDFVDGASAKLAPRNGRNLAYLESDVRASLHGCWGNWSVLARQSATLVASRGALDLAIDAARLGRPAGSEQWDVHGDYLGFAGAGIEWQGTWAPHPRWTLGLGAQGLLLRHLRERRVDGQAGFDAASQAYRFDLASFEAGDRLDFPFQSGFASRGWGVLLSAQIAWQDGPFGVRAAVRDAGWLRWAGLPQRQAQLASQTQAFDADGFVIYGPLIQGQNSQPGRRLSPPLRTSVAIDWRADSRTRFEARFDGLQGYGVLPAIGASREFGDLKVGLTWRTHEQRATLALAWKGVSVVYGSDRFGRGVRSEELALAYRWPN